MPTTITIDPVTRIEGHLQVDVTVDTVGGQLQVVDARSAGTMFRGFEIIMIGRDPRDAVPYTQRICGVCPEPHAMAAALNLDGAFGVTPPENARILRNFVLGGNFIASHLLHFYHLSALDYIDTTGLLDRAPWVPRWVTPDMVTGQTASTLVEHYVAALAMRRKSHQMGAIFSGKTPCIGSFVVGGITETVTQEKIDAVRALLGELRAFIDNVYVPDANLLAGAFPTYYQIGQGPGNLLCYGAFDLNASGTNKLFPRGRLTGGTPGTVDPALITEYVKYSWFTGASGNKNPAQGVTEPDPDKEGAYSWQKAPRYDNQVYEAGPLARLTVSGEYTHGISAMDRIVARALECKKVADAMNGWLDELVPGAPVYEPCAIPVQAAGMGLTEAARGALGHWMEITNSVVSRYQVITPTSWNASPRDDLDRPGALEAALIGTPVANIEQPIEVIRVIHTFDPCLACGVHLLRPGERARRAPVLVQPGMS